MDATDALMTLGEPIATRLQLRRLGVAAQDLTEAVRTGGLLRVRRGYYARPGTDPMLLHAVRIGGRLGCVAAAQSLGIWAATPPFAHVAMRHESSRLRSPHDRAQSLTPQNLDGCELHWWPLPGVRRSNVHTVSAAEALTHIARCQPRGLALASFDSAVYQRLVGPSELEMIFAVLPAKVAHLRPLIDGRCMSGIETLVRVMLLDAGIPFEVQVGFRGVGTVDFLVAGCVVVETDGHLGHDDLTSRLRDYQRDAALVRLGYVVVRLNYVQVMFDPAGALATIIAALRSHRRGPAF
jgi:very-short-patch-repair endonuclease